jgi:PAS domain S-box-containing protein
VTQRTAHLTGEIEKRLRAEKALKESEGRYRVLFEGSYPWHSGDRYRDETVCICQPIHLSPARLLRRGALPLNGRDQIELVSRFTPEGTFLFVNQGFCRFVGRRKEELLGTRWHPVAHDEDLPRIEKQIAHLCPANPVVLIENRVRNAHGEMRWVQFSNRAVFDDNAEIREIQSVGRDITEPKLIEQNLRESEEKYRLAMDADSDGLWDWDVRANLVYYSPAWCEILGEKSVSPVYESWEHRINPDDRDRVMASLTEHLEGKTRQWEC